MANRKHIFRRGPTSLSTLIVLISIALTLIFISAFTNWLQPLRSIALDMVAPLYRVTDIPGLIGGWTQDNFTDRDQLLREVQRLEDENLILQGRAATMADVQAENVRLRQLLNAAEMVQSRVLIAELVGIPPDLETHRIIINRGRVQDVRPGQPVIDDDGLVGQVINVGTEYSEVLLITDRDSAVPVQIMRNGLRAIADGTGNFDQLQLRYVPPTMDIRVGDELVTSGLGDKFPKGYPVGMVDSVNRSDSSPYLEVLVEPSVSLRSVRHMLLLFSGRSPLDGQVTETQP